MLDGKIRDRAGRLIWSKFRERRRLLDKEIRQITKDLDLYGPVRSGGSIKLIRVPFEQEVATRARIVWENIRRAHFVVGSPITPTLATDLKEEANYHIERMVEELFDLLANELRPVTRDALFTNLDSAKHEARGKFDVEVDLYVDSLEQESEAAETERNTTPAKDEKKNKGGVKKLLKIIVTIIVGLFVAFLADIFGNLGWTERITDFIYRIFLSK